MTNPITFISTFPTESTMRDGYYRRVHYVDQAFADEQKVHLDIRFAKNFVAKTIERDAHTRVLHLNAFLHMGRVWRVLKRSGIVYIHSIAKVPSVLFQMLFLKKTVPFALDLHGVMIDELKFEKKHIKAGLYSKIERFCFKHTRLNIFVSKAMQEHFQIKYPTSKGTPVIFANLSEKPATRNPQPETVYRIPETESTYVKNPQTAELRKNLGLQETDLLILYSGNLQPWQNIDLMLSTMESITDSRVKFLILSGQKKQFESKIRQYNIPKERISVLSVSPDELSDYYELAHYGFILRDDILVNRVANPTKLAEYLQYGIIPIVKLVEIGDYAEMGYEYIQVEKCMVGTRCFASEVEKPTKSQKNQSVYQKLSEQYGSAVLRQAVSETIGHTE